MTYLIIKAAVSGLLIAAISEIARRFPSFGGLVASLPFFLIFPALLERNVSFWLAVLAASGVTIILYGFAMWLASSLGITFK
jgi:hypothetical protein